MNDQDIKICADCGIAGAVPPAAGPIVYFSESMGVWLCIACGDKYFGV